MVLGVTLLFACYMTTTFALKTLTCFALFTGKHCYCWHKSIPLFVNK